MDRTLGRHFPGKESPPRFGSNGPTHRTLASLGRRVGPRFASDGSTRPDPHFSEKENRPRFAPDGSNLRSSLPWQGEQASLRLRWTDPSDHHFPWKESRPRFASDGSTRRNLTSPGRRVGLHPPLMDRPVRTLASREGKSASPLPRWIEPLAATFRGRRAGLASTQMDRLVGPSLP